jgi:hypothetical protein
MLTSFVLSHTPWPLCLYERAGGVKHTNDQYADVTKDGKPHRRKAHGRQYKNRYLDSNREDDVLPRYA